jgi:hypothetical protein
LLEAFQKAANAFLLVDFGRFKMTSDSDGEFVERSVGSDWDAWNNNKYER